MTIYLDHAATTSIRPEALEALDEAYRLYDRNASGLHSEARRAKNALEEARERAAFLLGTERPHDIVFTGSGTESDNLAVIGASLASDRRAVVVSSFEHPAVMEAARSLERFGFAVDELPVTRAGVIDQGEIEGCLDSPPAVVSVMYANNEIGTIQPIAEISARIRAIDPDVVIHSDAVQAFNSESVRLDTLGVDLITLASHKVGGPKGVGILAVGSGVIIEPVIHGGGHEAGRRAGTYNVAGIVAMVAAMEAVAADREGFRDRTGTERETFESIILDGWHRANVTAADSDRLPHISHIRFPGMLAETLLIRLDQTGLAAAAGSACQSGAVEPSYMLKAMGFSDVASGECVRFSFGWDTPTGEGSRAAHMVLDALANL